MNPKPRASLNSAATRETIRHRQSRAVSWRGFPCISPAEGLCWLGGSEVAAKRFADHRRSGGALGLGAPEQLAPEFRVQPD